MTSESQRELLSPRLQPNAYGLQSLQIRNCSPPSAFRLSTFFLQPTAYSLKPGLSLVELLIAIGILGVTMTLIGAAFPAGVMMSIAVSDETTSQAVFQKALAEIKGKLNRSEVIPDTDNPLKVVDYDALAATAPEVLKSRRLTDTSTFSWSALIRRVDDSATAGPMGNLCQVVVVVSRRPSGSPSFNKQGGGTSTLPELRKVNCTGSTPAARTLDIASTMVPNDGYIIDGTTGTAYIIVSRDEDNNKVVTLSTPPSDGDIAGNRDFWVVPGPESGGNYSPKSPAIRVFQAMLYLP